MDEKSIAKAFGAYVAQERKRQGISQGELAGRCDLTNKALSSIETGKSIPKLTTVVRILTNLGVELPEWLDI